MNIRNSIVLLSVSVLVVSGCTATRAMSAVNMDELGTLSFCELADSNSEGVRAYGSVDETVRFPSGGYAEIQEFTARSSDQGPASLALTSTMGLGLFDLTSGLIDGARAIDGSDCPEFGERRPTGIGACAFAKGQVIRYFSLDGDFVCSERKRIHNGYEVRIPNSSSCPTAYKEIVTSYEPKLEITAPRRDGLAPFLEENMCEALPDRTSQLSCMEETLGRLSAAAVAQNCG